MNPGFHIGIAAGVVLAKLYKSKALNNIIHNHFKLSALAFVCDFRNMSYYF